MEFLNSFRGAKKEEDDDDDDTTSDEGESSQSTMASTWQTPPIVTFAPTKETFEVWQERLQMYFEEIKCKNEAVQRSILLRSIGSEPYNLLHSICSPESPTSKLYAELCQLLNTHYTPPVIVFYERKNFQKARRTENESIVQWFAKVKRLALKCKFDTHFDSYVRDKFIVDLPEKIFEKMCEESEDITPDAALKKAIMLEAKFGTFKSHAKSNEQESSVNYVKKRGRYNNNNNNNKANCTADSKQTKSNDSTGKTNNNNETRGISRFF